MPCDAIIISVYMKNTWVDGINALNDSTIASMPIRINMRKYKEKLQPKQNIFFLIQKINFNEIVSK